METMELDALRERLTDLGIYGPDLETCLDHPSLAIAWMEVAEKSSAILRREGSSRNGREGRHAFSHAQPRNEGEGEGGGGRRVPFPAD